MRKPKPGFRMYLKARLKNPLTLLLPLSYELTYTSKTGDRFKERFSVHTAIFYIAVGALLYISYMYLNTTIWYFILWAVVLIIFSYIRYFWEEFDLLDENNEPIERNYKRSVLFYAFITLELALMVGLPAVVYTAALHSPYAKLSNPALEGKSSNFYTNGLIENFLQAFDSAADFADQNAPKAVLTQYGIVIYPDGEDYCFTFKKQFPSLFILRTYEFDSLFIYYPSNFDYGVNCTYWDSESLYSTFEPVPPPTAEIDTQIIIDILCASTDIKREDTESIYIGTNFFTDLPNLSDPGGDTWAVQVVKADTRYYYTVSLAEGTAVLEKTNSIEGE